MKIGRRNLSSAFGAFFKKRHYTALINMGRLSYPFTENFKRYVFGSGDYPYKCRISTPTGMIRPTLYSYYDLLTLNEIFFRGDYEVDTTDAVMVDIGSNIGLSALYFLTRNPAAKVHLFEPDPKNIDRLKLNLMDFSGRYVLNTCAVADQEGTVRFGRDLTSGRYGGIGLETGNYLDVPCKHINTVIEEVLRKENKIDALKIDTEGMELATVRAIAPEHLKKIGKIFLECTPDAELFPGMFSQTQDGTVCRLKAISQ